MSRASSCFYSEAAASTLRCGACVLRREAFSHCAWRPPLWWVIAGLVFLSRAAYLARCRVCFSAEMRAAVQPRLAVVSVSAHNSFGHPRREILERLANAAVGVPRRLSDFLPRPTHGQPVGSSLRSISAVSSACRYSSIIRRAWSASSSRTNTILPPTPG